MAENLFSQIQSDYKLKQHREKVVRNELAAKEEVKDRLKDVLSSQVEQSLDVVDDAVASADLAETLDEEEIQDLEARRKAAAALREKRLKKGTGLFGLFGKKKEDEMDDAGPSYDDSFTRVEVKKAEANPYNAGISSSTVISFDDEDDEIIDGTSVTEPVPAETVEPDEPAPISVKDNAEAILAETEENTSDEAEETPGELSEEDKPVNNEVSADVSAFLDKIADAVESSGQNEVVINLPQRQEVVTADDGEKLATIEEQAEYFDKTEGVDKNDPVDVKTVQVQEEPQKVAVPEGARLLADGKTVVRLNKKAHMYELVSDGSVKQYKQRLFKDIDAVVDYFDRKACAVAGA